MCLQGSLTPGGAGGAISCLRRGEPLCYVMSPIQGRWMRSLHCLHRGEPLCWGIWPPSGAMGCIPFIYLRRPNVERTTAERRTNDGRTEFGGITELRIHGITDSRNYGFTELRNSLAVQSLSYFCCYGDKNLVDSDTILDYGFSLLCSQVSIVSK